MAYISICSQLGETAEWSACTPINLKVVGSSPASITFFPPLFHGGFGHLSILQNIAVRVVSVAKLLEIVSRLG